jgi:parallel beta helix pectate lyase-like protein
VRRWRFVVVVACVAAAGCVPASGWNAGAGAVVRVPASIDATGRRDVTTPLHAFLARVPNGSTVAFRQGGRYRVEGTLRLRDRHDLTFLGNGATIFATTKGDRTRSQWQFVRGQRITFRNLIVRGAHPHGGTSDSAYQSKYEAQHGFWFAGTRDVLLDHVTVTDVYGDFVYIAKDLDTRIWSERVTIRWSTFARNGRQGISVTAGRDVRIEHNTITQTRRSTIDLEPNTRSWGAERVVIADNVIGPGRLMFVAAGGAAGRVDHVQVLRNVLRHHLLNIDVVASSGSRRTDWVIDGNRSDMWANQRTIRLVGVDNVVVRDNHQRLRKAVPGIVLWRGCNYHVSGNDLGPGRVSLDPTRCA